ncbi:MAG: SelB C-terminal domain-containing protein, partial [Chloroflexota bacterium]
LAQQPHRPDLGRPRLSIDRVFTLTGFGTVVTGTLIDGSFRVGDEISIIPGDFQGRIRGLQTHKRKEEFAQAGSRTAINISGVDMSQVTRGQVVALPDTFLTTRRIDVNFKLLSVSRLPLKHDDQVKFFVGAAEAIARVRLLGKKILQPGDHAWLQLELQEPIVAVRSDRYIIRRPSPGETIGGGYILDPHPLGRHKRFDEDMIARLEALSEGSPVDVIFQTIAALQVGQYSEIIKKSNLQPVIAKPAVQKLINSDQILLLEDSQVREDSLIANAAYWQYLEQQVINDLQTYHEANPLRLGMPRGELNSRLEIDNHQFNILLTRLKEQDRVNELGPIIALYDLQISFSDEQQKKTDGLIAQFAASPFSPPTIKTCIKEIGEDLYLALVDLGKLIPLSSEVAFRPEDYQQALIDVRTLIETNGSVTLAQARDHWGTTRRYVQAILEYMDKEKITVRKDDSRVLRAIT